MDNIEQEIARCCGTVADKERMQKAVKELADQLADATQQISQLAWMLREAGPYVERAVEFSESEQIAGCHNTLITHIDAALAGKLPEQHPDDAAVDRFATAMKAKLAAAREKGRGGWDDPEACSVEFLADLLVGHVGKGNPGNFEDIANLAMMLHQRGADPAILANADKIAHNAEKLIMGIDALFAGKLPERPDTEWTDAASTPIAEDYRELQVQHDQLQSKYKSAMDVLREAAWQVSQYAPGSANLLKRIDALLDGQVLDHPEQPLAMVLNLIYYMRDNHTFKRLSDDVETAIGEIVAELDAGFTSGMLCSKRPGFVNIGTNYRQPREEFLSACREALLAAAPKTEWGA